MTSTDSARLSSSSRFNFFYSQPEGPDSGSGIPYSLGESVKRPCASSQPRARFTTVSRLVSHHSGLPREPFSTPPRIALGARLRHNQPLSTSRIRFHSRSISLRLLTFPLQYQFHHIEPHSHQCFLSSRYAHNYIKQSTVGLLSTSGIR